ncbi:MAG: PEPxxWA-CTERM sorting domain-containing protein, partial [Polymorphobacter sp.]
NANNGDISLIIKHFSAAIIVAALSTTAAIAAPPSYRLVKLAPPAGSGGSTVARAISANGSIAGEGQLGTLPGNRPINFGTAAAPASAFTAVPTGTDNAFVRGINDSGVAAGTAQDSVANTSQAILTGTSGVTVLAAASGFANAGASGINSGGTVAGYSMQPGIFAAEGTARPFSGNGTQVATVWNGGVATVLNNPFGGFNSIATAINASGQIAGVANRATTGALSNAVVWNSGVATVLATANTERSTARAISSSGWVAGRMDQLADGSFQGSVWDAGGSQFSVATLAGCAVSDLRGINASNNAVGFAQQGSCGTVGGYWQWNGGGYTAFDLNSLVVNLGGWNLIAPQSINDRGQIVGFGTDEFGVNQGFLLQAVPEPATWSMLIIGFGLVGGAVRRRRAGAAAA